MSGAWLQAPIANTAAANAIAVTRVFIVAPFGPVGW
jgi:hypothetical protein